MDDIEEGWDLLHLVHDEHLETFMRAHQIAETLRPGQILALLTRIQQIDHEGVREHRPQPGRFSGASGTEEEEVTFVGTDES